MRTIDILDMQVRSGARGPQVMAWVDGEWIGVSRVGEDNCVADIDTIKHGDEVEVGSEIMRVVRRLLYATAREAIRGEEES